MSPEQLAVLEPEKTVDARGTACPGPLLEAKRAVTQVSKGAVLEVLSSDRSTNKDIPVWAAKVGHDYLGTIEEAGYWKIYVRRAQ
ncbi:MAG: sulfurtransferase TusA family protein [Gemmatimonadales bacterium]|jgi:TusA-related sulfurtransferase